MHRISLLIILAIAAAAQAVPWERHRAGEVVIYVPRGHTELAQQVAVIVREQLPRLRREVGMTGHLAPISIYAYLDSATFHRDTHTNGFVRGLTTSPPGKISLDATIINWELRHVVEHEMVHNLIGQRLGSRLRELPVWVNEGMAEALTSTYPYWLTRHVTVPFVPERTVPLGRLTGAFQSSSEWKNQMAYLQSGAMVSWLDFHHPGAMRRTLAGMAHGQSFAVAFSHAANLTPAAWFTRWHADDRSAEHHGRYLLYGLLALWLLTMIVRRIRGIRRRLRVRVLRSGIGQGWDQ